MSGRLGEISSTFDSPRSDNRGSHLGDKASKSAGKEENRFGLGSGDMSSGMELSQLDATSEDVDILEAIIH